MQKQFSAHIKVGLVHKHPSSPSLRWTLGRAAYSLPGSTALSPRSPAVTPDNTPFISSFPALPHLPTPLIILALEFLSQGLTLRYAPTLQSGVRARQLGSRIHVLKHDSPGHSCLERVMCTATPMMPVIQEQCNK